VEHALEVRIAHADLVHVLERVADVVDARAAHADALRDQARAAVQVELAHVGRVLRIGHESERAYRARAQRAREGIEIDRRIHEALSRLIR